jgi:hypothetical protein
MIRLLKKYKNINFINIILMDIHIMNMYAIV